MGVDTESGVPGPTGVRTAVSGIGAMLEGDGAGIEFLGFESGTLRLRLLLEDAECAECVVPVEMLESIALTIARRATDEVLRVTIEDERTA